MSRDILPAPNSWQPDPAPRPEDRRARRRTIIVVIVILLGAGLVAAGLDLDTVLLTLLGTGLAGATIARWVNDDGPLPDAFSVLRSQLR